MFRFQSHHFAGLHQNGLAIALTRHFNFACFIAADAEIAGFVVFGKIHNVFLSCLILKMQLRAFYASIVGLLNHLFLLVNGVTRPKLRSLHEAH